MRNAVVASTCGVRLAVKVFEPRATSGSGANSSAVPRAAPHNVFVFVHPWGLLGGSWYNTQGLATECAAQGATGVCFNLRGVHPSTGRGSLCGHAEVDDVEAVVNWAHAEFCGRDICGRDNMVSDSSGYAPCKIWIVAQSAGSTTAGSAMSRLDRGVCSGICFIGYTFGCATSVLFGRHYRYALRLPEPEAQKSFYISGTSDCFTTEYTLRRALARANHPSAVYLIKGAGHFEIEQQHFDLTFARLLIAFAKGGIDQLEELGTFGPGKLVRTVPGSYPKTCIFFKCWDFCTKCVACILISTATTILLIILGAQGYI